MASYFSDTGVTTAAVQDGNYGASYQTNDPRTNPLYDFLGAPTNSVPVSAFSHRGRVNQTLLDAYRGRNALLSDTIEGLILSDTEPETTVIMPWCFTEEQNFKMHTIVFDQAMPSLTPHEGTSRLMTTHTTEQSYSSQRFGIKMRLEGDFAGTAQGRAAYYRNLIQM
jgi:hypothetical protein